MQALNEKLIVKTGLLGLFLFVSAFGVADVSEGMNDPKLLFDKMRQAKTTVLYRGSLAYERGEQLFSYSVDSSDQSQSGFKTLQSLSGQEKVFQVENESDCSERSNVSLDQLSNWYNFSYVGRNRVAGRQAYEIALRPVDPYRLGYSYLIDQETGLMLRSVTMRPDRRILERMQFVDLQILESQQTVEVIDYEDLSYQNTDAAPDSELQVEMDLDQCNRRLNTFHWSFTWTPEGFQLVESVEAADKASLVYSDGISAYSLFIEPLDQVSLPVGSTQQGATTLMINYYAVEGVTYMITFVGEVPIATAERVLSGLSRRQ